MTGEMIQRISVPCQKIKSLKSPNGKYKRAITAEVNRHLLSGEFNRIVSVGQVVPHEVVGMANYTKNLLVGVGGRDMINSPT